MLDPGNARGPEQTTGAGKPSGGCSKTHCYTTIVVPTKGGKTYRLRKAGEPEELQKAIYEKLGVNWERLPRTKLEVEAAAIL